MKIDRAKNTVRNTIWGLINKVVILLCPFIIRTLMTVKMGDSYVGLGSLFSSIIMMLNLAELGFGSAVVYCMYEPIAKGDNERVCALLNLYKKIYMIIGLIVLVIGIVITPLLPFFIKDAVPSDINIYSLYLVYLADTVLAYWALTYRISILRAIQRNDICDNIMTAFYLIMYIAQIVVIITIKEYYIYAVMLPLTDLTVNIFTAGYAKKKYPEYVPKGEVDKEEKSAIKKQVSGLLFQKFAFSSRNAFDSIIISAFLGLVVQAHYNNYFYIINALTAILAIFFSSMQAGIGNSVVLENTEKNFEDMKKIHILYIVIAGWCSVCLWILFQPFMKIWMGEDKLLSTGTVLLFAVYFYLMKMTDSIGAYISATGTWWKCKWIYAGEAVTNLLLNILLGYYFGITGVIVATIISVFFINYLFTGYVLFKNYFGLKYIFRFYKDEVIYALISLIIGVLVTVSVRCINYNNVFSEITIKALICLIIPGISYLVMYFISSSFKESVKWALVKIKK